MTTHARTVTCPHCGADFDVGGGRAEMPEEVADVAAALNADMVVDPRRERPPDAPRGEEAVPRQGTP